MSDQQCIGIESNRQAVGAKVELIDNQGKRYYDELTAGNGWVSQNSQLFHFGLGEAEGLDSLIVHWPCGLRQSLEPVATQQIYTIIEGREPTEGISFDIPAVTSTTPLQTAASIQIEAYPNPADKWLTVSVDHATEGITELSLLTLSGQTIWRETWPNAQATPLRHRFELSNLQLTSGVYILTCQTPEQVVRRQVVIK